MFNVKVIYSHILCTNKDHTKYCSEYCERKKFVDGDFCEEESFGKNIRCSNSAECSNSCLVANTDDMIFTGVTYDSEFYPEWNLKINDIELDSSFNRLVKLCVDEDVVYDITRDDLRFWYKNNKDDRKKLCEFMTSNNCSDGDFIDRYFRSMKFPCNSSELLFDFLNKMQSLDKPLPIAPPPSGAPSSFERLS